jgi:tetratricopeptide (TPR) repeat protein/Zn finger protein HypA/HybF involved in hydrogenase expression
MLQFFIGAGAAVQMVGAAPVDEYSGSEACRSCHPDEFARQSKSEHARALALTPPGSPGHWAFGAGTKATTYVSQVTPDQYLEHGFTYYTATKSMALTPGHTNSEGLRYRTFDPVASILRCFRCHSTGTLRVDAALSVQPSELGVHCESCHGPGAAHVKSQGAKGTIRNPGKLNGVSLNVFCGECHRKPPEVGQETDLSNAWNTRHQPDYLSHAACFRNSNGSLSCLTCHDPHSTLSRSAADYDKRCSGCHKTVRHRSAVAARSCVECHMPQVVISPHLRFTNHWIGIYGKGASQIPVPSATRKELPPPRRAIVSGTEMAPPNDPADLKPLFEGALASSEKKFGLQSMEAARSASDLGLFLKTLNDSRSAVAPLTRALQIDQTNGSARVQADQESLATALLATGKTQEAYDLFRAAAQGEDPAIAARCLTELAALDSGNSEAYYRLALQREEKSVGKDDPLIAVVLNNLALALRQKNDNRSAEPLFRRALAIQESKLGTDHTATATTLNNLGSLLQSIGQLAEAERLERRAMRIFEEKLGPESLELATTCNNVADVVWARKDGVSAAQLYRRALAIDESLYGPDNPELTTDLVNLGLLLKEMGESAAASASLNRALAIYEKAFGAGSPQVRQLRETIGSRER